MFAKVYLEITNVCNMSCSFCPGTSRKKHFMSANEFSVLAKKIRPYTEFLYFHLMGEPLLHPELRTFLDISQCLGFRVIITTNGTLLNDATDILLSSPAVFKISISLHSFEANTKTTDHYFKNCFDFAEKAADKGIITVFRLWNNGGESFMNDSIYKFLKARFDGEWVRNTKGIRIRKKLFIEVGDKFDWPLHSKKSTENITCFGLKDHVGVLCDGSVVPCCMDYDGNFILGNLFEQDIESIINSDKAQLFRSKLDMKEAPCEMCKTCGFAQKKFLHI